MVCGKLEIDILNAFWNISALDENKNISIQDIVDFLSSQGVERAYTTIKTVMDRLVTKSILVRYKSGKKFFYSATMSREEMALMAVNEVSSQFFGGNMVSMIRFIESKCVSDLV